MNALPSDRPAASGIGLPGRGFDDLPDVQATDFELLRRESGAQPAAGPDHTSALAAAAAIRFPNLRELEGRARIEAIVDHVTATAIARGELEELRLDAHTRLFGALAEIGRVAVGVTKTRAAIDEAKRLARPDLAETIDGCRWLISRCTEQIERFGGSEYEAASRAYTMLGG